jgi:hypothetical protein
MSRMMSCTLLGGALLLSFVSVAAQIGQQEQLGRGGEWLSWSPSARSAYINGFIDGYLRGSHTACDATDKLFEVDKPHRLGDSPSGRCEAKLEVYSKYRYKDSEPDFSAYTQVITDFYTKHPQYQGIPFFYLLSFLSDNKYKTADQLYEMAEKGEMRTHF